MALKPCRECGQDVSTSAKSCPNCGTPHPTRAMSKGATGCLGFLGIVVVIGMLSSLAGGDDYRSTTSSTSGSANAGTPRVSHSERYAHQTINIRARPTTDSRVVSQAARGASVFIGQVRNGWAPVFRWRSSTDTTGFIYAQLLRNTPLPELEIESWNWRKDAGFGTDGAVIWTAVIRNNTTEYIRNARVEFTSLDANGRVMDTDFSYASGLAPGGTASAKGYATYFGGEERGRIRIVDW